MPIVTQSHTTHEVLTASEYERYRRHIENAGWRVDVWDMSGDVMLTPPDRLKGKIPNADVGGGVILPGLRASWGYVCGIEAGIEIGMETKS